MDLYTATEEAYKKGFRNGYQAGKAAAGISSEWGTGKDGERSCLECGHKGSATRFCPDCGSFMKNHAHRIEVQI